jgi:hypothetical protein
MISKALFCFIYIYILFLSATDIFRFYAWLPLYQYFLIPLLFLSLLNGVRIVDYKADIFLLIMLCLLLFSSVLSPNDKTLSYILAYFYVIFGMYFLVKSALITSQINFRTILKVNFYGVILLSTYILFEVSLKGFVDLDISSYLYRTREATATFYFGLYRAYGFSTEPTAVAWYLNSFALLAIYYIVNNFKTFFVKYVLILIIICSFVLTFSSAGFLYLFLGLLFVIFKYNLYRIFYSKIFLFHMTLLVLIIFNFPSISDGIYYFVEGITDKIFLNTEYVSVNQRINYALLAFERFAQAPIIGGGLGLSSSFGESSPMSWYLIILTNGGLLSLLALLMFTYLKIYQVMKIHGNIGIYMTFSVVASFLTLATNAAFFNPFLWTLLAIVGLYRYESANIKGGNAFGRKL